MSRQLKYKPLLFTTTVRNPQRIKNFLRILKKYDGYKLNDQLAEKIVSEIIQKGLYKPKNMNSKVKSKIKAGEPLTAEEVEEVMRDNPQKHKEAGFSSGWPSRFDTLFKITKILGFVFYKPSEKIKFSKIGLKLADNHAYEIEQQAFVNAFVKYQRNNPFLKVKNENIPLILLLKVIKKLNSDKDFNKTGISKLELPLIIYWKDQDSHKLYKRLKELRKSYRFAPSSEVIMGICRDEIMEGNDIQRKDKSIMVDYVDEFIRKMRLTGLISLRGGGRFIDINKKEQTKVNYIIKTYSKYKKYNTEKSYFNYISSVDNKFFSISPKSTPIQEREKSLEKWLKVYPWEKIKIEMLNLAKKIPSSDGIFKYIYEPIRLEFLTALAVKSQIPDARVIPNYPIDDEGLPTSTASGTGNKGDIECFEGLNGILVEVTMSGGPTQTRVEVWPISRHLEEFEKKVDNDAMCYFIAPSIFIDSKNQIEYVRDTQKRFISPMTIGEFLEYLESSDRLYSAN